MSPSATTRDSLDSVLRALAGSPEISVQTDMLPAGHVVGGRYEILRLLGRGGFGVVFLARDQRLSRNVALKLHRRFHGPSGIARLESEARAMASMSHPNLAEVYGLVREGDHLFVVMEYVCGGDARQWSRALDRSPAEVLEVFLAAGRGLAAAHAQGVVHGDFKPDNVLVGHTGRARVIDFGLGARDGAAAATSSADDAGRTRRSQSNVTAWVGTRGYMPPEQLEGDLTDASDQFAYCVSLFELLFGVRPQAGASSSELHIVAERARPHMAGLGPLVAVIARGLRAAPASRWPDVGAMLDALEDCVHRQRPRRLGVIAGLPLLVIGGAATIASADAERPCIAEADELQRRYDATLRPPLALAFEQHRAGPQLWTAVDERLTDYARRWSTTFATACTLPAPAQRAAIDCLQQRQLAFGANVAILSHGTSELQAEAPGLVSRLPDLSSCAAPAEPTTTVPLPDDPALAVKVEEVRAQIAALETLRRGAYPEATTEAANALLDRARRLDFPEVRPEVHRQVAVTLFGAGDPAQALSLLEGAYFMARRLRRDRLAMSIAVDLANLAPGGRPTAETWLRHADALLETTHDPRAPLEVEAGRAFLEVQWGEYEAADRRLTAVLERSQEGQLSEDQHPRWLLLLAEIAIRSGRYDDASTRLDAASEAIHATFGGLSREQAMVLDFRSWMHHERGESDAALKDARAAFDMTTLLFGPDHPLTLRMLGGVAIAEGQLGNHEAALLAVQQVLAGHQARLGPEHRLVALAHLNLGVDLLRVGRFDDAEVHLREALRQYESGFGGDLDVAIVLLNLATLHADRKDDGDAERGLEVSARALEIRERELGPDHLDALRARINLGFAQLATDVPADAVVNFETVRAVLDRVAPAQPLHINVRLGLARGTLALGHMADAETHATAALSLLEAHPSDELQTSVEHVLAQARSARPTAE